jgi:hypothetical protein
MKKFAVKIGVGGILFLLPFFVMPMATGDMQSQFDAPKLLASFVLGNLCFALYLAEEVSAFFGLAHAGFAAAVFFSGFGSWQIYPSAFEAAGMMCALWFVKRTEPDRIFYLKLMAVSGCLVALQAYLQTMGLTWPLQFAPGIDHHHPIAFLGQHTKMGAYLAPIAALLCALEWWPFAAFVGFVCLLTGSSFTVLALGVGMLVVVRHRIGLRCALGIILAGAIILGGVFLWKPHMDAFAGNGRSAVWRETITCAKERPWFGFGPGGFGQVFASHCESKQTGELNGHFQQAHNDFLQVLFDGGWIGVLFLSTVLFGIFRAYFYGWWQSRQCIVIGVGGWRESHAPSPDVRAAQGMLAALLANAVGNFPWQLSPHYILGLISSAILLHEAKMLGTIFPWPQPTSSLLPTSSSRWRSIWAQLTT